MERLQWKLVLADAVALRSKLHDQAKQSKEALADAQRAVELLEPTIGEGSGYLYELGASQTAYRELAEKLGKVTPAANAPADLETCVSTLRKAVGAGFDIVSILREDLRLRMLRERRIHDFDRLIDGAVAAGKTPLPSAVSEPRGSQ